jgi:hypothetical protein
MVRFLVLEAGSIIIEHLQAWALSASVINYMVTLFGAMAMYLFSLAKGFRGSKPALRRLLPGKSEVSYDRIDFVIIIVTGSIIGTICFRPNDPLQALSAGFGWTGAVNILTSHRQR